VHVHDRPSPSQAALAVLLVVLAASLAASCSEVRTQTATADVIFSGQFITLDPVHPRVEAVAVVKGRIVAAGSRAEIERFASNTTLTIQIPGVALPGFADAHVHLSGLGQQLERLNLRGLNKEQVLAKVAEAARATPPGGWIGGGGWDQGFFRPPVFPSASDLDAVSGEHPVALSRIDGHSSWVNSKALTLAGISSRTPDPQGGRIVRNAANQPTGILVDRAQDALNRVRPARGGGADRERHIRAALQQYARWGLTSVHDAGTDLDTIAVYKALLARGDLPVRLYVMARGSAATEHYLTSGPEPDLGGGLLAVRSFKVVSDGALGSRGAELTAPYADAPGERGLQQVSDADLDRLVRSARAKGFQVNVHAIGDRAVHRVLDVFEHAGVTREERFRIEHASMIAPGDLPRFAALGIIASIQPVFVGEYSRWSDDRVGPARMGWVLPTRNLLESGAKVAFGTDYTASDSGDPISTLSGAVMRQSLDGQPPAGWHNEQRIDVDQALRLMTMGPAFAAFQEHDLGQISVGRYADFTIVSADPHKVAGADLRALSVRMTVVAGRVTFDGAKQENTK
jgi:predicted amidohydrolase YtcJ